MRATQCPHSNKRHGCLGDFGPRRRFKQYESPLKLHLPESVGISSPATIRDLFLISLERGPAHSLPDGNYIAGAGVICCRRVWAPACAAANKDDDAKNRSEEQSQSDYGGRKVRLFLTLP